MIAVTAGRLPITKELINALLYTGHLIKVLVKSEEDQALLEQNNSSNAVKFIIGNVLDISALALLLEGVKWVYHLDEIVSYFPVSKNEMYDYNIQGTANVVNVALQAQLEKVIFLSSIFAIGDKAENVLFDEESKWNDVKDAEGYGWSKHLAEREIWRGINEGLDAVIINAGHIISKDSIEKQLALSLKYLVEKNECSEGNLNLLDSDDLVKILLQLADDKFTNEQYIAFGGSISFKELFKEMSTTIGKSVGVNLIPTIILNQRARYKKIISILTRNKYSIPSQLHVKMLGDMRAFSSQKIKKETNYNFVDINATIGKLVDGIKHLNTN